jgi:3-dehydroquinate synthase
MATVTIELPHHHYQAVIEPGALARVGQIIRGLAPHRRCALIADEAVFAMHGEALRQSLADSDYDPLVHAMPSGEPYKTLDTVRQVYDVLLEGRLERGSPIVALGGGVTGDMVGFVAATYLRGVPFVQCPTTLLAMVDASVGGKVGVNVPQGKNLIGAFYHPLLVVMDPRVLKTLPARQMRGGLAECVKHGVIRDAELFDWTEEQAEALLAADDEPMIELLQRNVRIKADVVMADEKESGVRAHLNFGHTFAHAIEVTSGFGRIEHGEAVSLGMVAASRLAADLGYCDPVVPERVTAVLERIGLPVSAELPPIDKLMAAMKLDKKVRDARVRLVLPRRLGEVFVTDRVEEEPIRRAWRTIRM